MLCLQVRRKLGHVSASGCEINIVPVQVKSSRQWFGRNALVTRVVCFSRSSKETRTCLQKGFCFILMMKIMEPFQKPENTLFLFHLAIRLQFLGQFGFLRERVCDFVIMFTVNVFNSFQSMF